MNLTQRRSYPSFIIFIVYSNIWISIGATLWTLATQWIFHLDFSIVSSLFVGFATLFTYNFQRLVKLQTAPEKISLRNTWIKQNKIPILILSIIGAAGALASVFFMPMRVLWLMIPFGIISLGYAIKFLPSTSKRLNLRSLPGLKILLISLTWAVSTVFVPLLEAGVSIDSQHFVYAMERLFFVVAITIPFDIRDIQFDASSLKTLPQILGIRNSLWLAVLLLFICAALDLWLFGLGILSFPSLLGLYFSYCIAGLFITLTTHTRPELYFTGVIDGLFALQSLLLVMELLFPSYFILDYL